MDYNATNNITELMCVWSISTIRTKCTLPREMRNFRETTKVWERQWFIPTTSVCTTFLAWGRRKNYISKYPVFSI